MDRILSTTKPYKRKKISRATLEKLFLSTFVIVVLILVGLTTFLITRQISHSGVSSFGINLPIFSPASDESNIRSESDEALNSLSPDNPDDPGIISNLTPWDGAGRVTILILGLDYRDWASREKYSRSDTMILLTLDPLTKTAGMLSIPRDMWVAIPGFDHGKINTAYFLGEAYKYPGGGPALAVKTVEQFLGVPINYYAQIDFGAFVRFIDELGGVKIDVPEKITIDLIGDGAETKKTLKPGVQVLPGEWALAYARNRSTGGGDFDRADRQQQVIMAMRNQILSFNMLPTLITKAPILYKELSSGINTNMSLDEVLKLALLAKDVQSENINRAVIGEEYILFARSPDNLSILIPLPDKIHIVRDQLFTSTGGLGPETPGDDRERMKAEGAKLAIFNSSSSYDLGPRTAEYFRQMGVNVTQVDSSTELQPVTKIIDHTGNPYLIKYLVDLMGISEKRIYSEFDPFNPVDVEVHLGNDWASDSQIP